MPKNLKVFGQKLRRHHNFNEYWACATCGRPRRKNTPRRKPCKNCRGVEPPRLRITERRGQGDTAHDDSRVSKELFAAAVYAREGLGIGTKTFPQGAPARGLLGKVIQHEANTRSSKWFCQVFIQDYK